MSNGIPIGQSKAGVIIGGKCICHDEEMEGTLGMAVVDDCIELGVCDDEGFHTLERVGLKELMRHAEPRPS